MGSSRERDELEMFVPFFELYVVQRLLDVTSPPSKHIFIFVIQAAFLPLYVHHHIQFALYSFPVVGVKYQYRSPKNAL